jgi:transposase
MGVAMRESTPLIRFWGCKMPRPYSDDLRRRAIEAVEGGASRREAAERLDTSPSTVIKWVRRWREDGSAAAKPSRGSISPLEKHAKWLLSLVAKQADRTLDEVVIVMNKRGISGSRSAVSRFYIRHDMTFKKKSACHGAGPGGRSSRAQALGSRTRHV